MEPTTEELPDPDCRVAERVERMADDLVGNALSERTPPVEPMNVASDSVLASSELVLDSMAELETVGWTTLWAELPVPTKTLLPVKEPLEVGGTMLLGMLPVEASKSGLVRRALLKLACGSFVEGRPPVDPPRYALEELELEVG